MPQDIYVKTHIRIDCAAYRRNGQIGWQDEAEKLAFDQEVADVLGPLGFKPQEERSAMRSIGVALMLERGKESLYCHPDDLSGWLQQGSKQAICEAISSKCKTFKLRWVDEYESKVDCAPEEYAAQLAKHADEIRSRLLERLKTPNRNRFYARSTAQINTSDLYNPMDEVGGYSERNTLKNTFGAAKSGVVAGILERLIAEGLVEERKDGEHLYLRARNKTEMEKIQRAKRAASKSKNARPHAAEDGVIDALLNNEVSSDDELVAHFESEAGVTREVAAALVALRGQCLTSVVKGPQQMLDFEAELRRKVRSILGASEAQAA